MKIWTGYFAKVRSYEFPVAVSATVPSFFEGLRFPSLAPSYSLLREWKEGPKDATAEKKYSEAYLETLREIGLDALGSGLVKVTGGRDCVLVCWEKTGSFCHRVLAAEYLAEHPDVTYAGEKS